MNINKKLNRIIEEHIPKGTRVAPFLMDLLNLSRESAYRRLRNQTSYSMEEAIILISKLNLSIEEVFGYIVNENRISVTIDTVKENSPSTNYAQIIKDRIKELETISISEESKVYYVGNKIPESLLLQYKMLSKLRYIKWIHQAHNIPFDLKFSDIIVPEEILELHDKYIDTCKKINHYIGIFDYNIIQASINIVKFYYKRNLIEDAELIELRNELYSLLNELETVSSTGKAFGNVDVSLFFSYLQIESNSILLESKETMKVCLLSSGKNSVTTNNIKICQDQKRWIESLQRFSTLISSSNEILQAEVFSKLHKNLESQLSLPIINDVI